MLQIHPHDDFRDYLSRVDHEHSNARKLEHSECLHASCQQLHREYLGCYHKRLQSCWNYKRHETLWHRCVRGHTTAMPTAIVYQRLPSSIPIHWDMHRNADNYGPRWTVFIPPAVMALLLFFFAVLPRLSPRNFEVDSFRSTYLAVRRAPVYPRLVPPNVAVLFAGYARADARNANANTTKSSTLPSGPIVPPVSHRGP